MPIKLFFHELGRASWEVWAEYLIPGVLLSIWAWRRRKRLASVAKATAFGLITLVASVAFSWLITPLLFSRVYQTEHKPYEPPSPDAYAVVAGVVVVALVEAWGTLRPRDERVKEPPPRLPAPQIEPFSVVKTENDLLKLDSPSFLESGFGGLLRGRKRKT